MAALLCSEMCSRVPVIVILGATGSGKSKLGIEIARKYGGEILSADSMQVYRGLDIITNKVTDEERAMAPHHLLDVVTPLQPFSVRDFRDAALPIMARLMQQRRLPVVVGGTNYYIESLLWHVLVSSEPPHKESSQEEHRPPPSESQAQELGTGSRPSVPLSAASQAQSQASEADSRVLEAREPESPAAGAVPQPPLETYVPEAPGPGPPPADASEPECKKPRLSEDLEALSSPELHRRLQEVDPERARTLHPNNRRRIIRSLEVFAQLGRLHSDVLREQQAAEGGSDLGGPLRYPHSAILWLRCDKDTLDNRLNARVDDMVQRGLVKEMLDFHTQYNAQRIADDKEADYTKGIFQSIGFKEFHEYLVLPEGEREGPKGRRLFARAVDDLKMVTRRYARKQVRWIVNRFLRRPNRQVPPVYAFDSSDPSKWEETVFKPAVHIVDYMLEGRTPTDITPLPIEEALNNVPTSFYCDVCERVFIGNLQWGHHLKSNKHARVLKRKQEIAAQNQEISEVKKQEVLSDETSVETENSSCTTISTLKGTNTSISP